MDAALGYLVMSCRGVLRDRQAKQAAPSFLEERRLDLLGPWALRSSCLSLFKTQFLPSCSELQALESRKRFLAWEPLAGWAWAQTGQWGSMLSLCPPFLLSQHSWPWRWLSQNSLFLKSYGNDGSFTTCHPKVRGWPTRHPFSPQITASPALRWLWNTVWTVLSSRVSPLSNVACLLGDVSVDLQTQPKKKVIFITYFPLSFRQLCPGKWPAQEKQALHQYVCLMSVNKNQRNQTKRLCSMKVRRHLQASHWMKWDQSTPPLPSGPEETAPTSCNRKVCLHGCAPNWEAAGLTDFLQRGICRTIAHLHFLVQSRAWVTSSLKISMQ